MPWFAHSSPDGDEPLERHLAEVGEMAAAFAGGFKAAEWGRAVGLLHDVGKATEAFQRRLRGGEKVDHATAGGAAAIERLKPLGRMLAYAVVGHHGGLPDPGRLDERLGRRPEYDRGAVPALPALVPPAKDLKGLGASLFVRMLYSSLVDADFLATERFYDSEKTNHRGVPFDAAALLARLHRHLDGIMAEAMPSRVNTARREVLARCLAMAARPPGVFSLSVPTGGGKTLASLAFALAHAKENKKYTLRRVVMVIPYTSIIEQTAAIYRDALGDAQVLEHHSNFRHPDDRDGVEAGDRRKLRLAEENWDAPVVVTTSVQFFESLFSNRSSRCRKLHNLAGAVIVLDEAQLLPLRFLAPCLEVLRALTADYGCTLVLCTATQPALADKTWLPRAFDTVTEIMDDPTTLHGSLRRVAYEWAGDMTDEAVAERLLAQDQALAVVNTRGHARDLFEHIRHAPGAVHLSALMSPAHRSRVLACIRADLANGRPCRVVSTQLVECGVDLDFPVVLRALAGLDSIIQAAGRCNRSGKPDFGRVTVFQPAGQATPSLWTNHANLARRVLEDEFPADPAQPEAVRWYFQRLYDRAALDERGILDLLKPKAPCEISFSTAAEAFSLIDDGQVDVTIAVDDEARDLLRRLETDGPNRDLLRALQRHTVQISAKAARTLGTALRRVGERVLVLDEACYDPVVGVVIGPR